MAERVEFVPIIRVQILGMLERCETDACFGCEHALHEFVTAHFQTENHSRQTLVQCGVTREIHAESTLAHARTSRDYDHLSGLQSVCQRVDVTEAGGCSELVRIL